MKATRQGWLGESRFPPPALSGSGSWVGDGLIALSARLRELPMCACVLIIPLSIRPLSKGCERVTLYARRSESWRKPFTANGVPKPLTKSPGRNMCCTRCAMRSAAGGSRMLILFSGPRGTGKTTMARLLAKAVNCLNPDPAARPDNTCSICTAIAEGRMLDLIELDAASNRGIDEIRDLRDKINFAPGQARYKVYIIDEVHMLTEPAFNALLKTLEEPPAHAIFVLATTDPQKVPATIVSRCQPFAFRRLTVAEIAARLQELVTGEGLTAEPEALTLIARQATGAMRDAVSMLDQLAAGGDEITVARAQAALGAGALRWVTDVLNAVCDANAAAGLDAINQAVDSGADARQFARQIVEQLRSLMLIKLGDPALVDIPAEQRATYNAQAERLELDRLTRAIKLFNQAALDLRGGWQPQLPLELALVEALQQPAAPLMSASACCSCDTKANFPNGSCPADSRQSA